VDFVLRRGRELIAIEVKSSQRWKPEYARGLRAIGELKGLRRRIAGYLGPHVLAPEPGIEVLPLADFLQLLERGLS
jgi:predicted AAA+ superfamily ATPase